MRTLGHYQFPEVGNKEEGEQWTAAIHRVALSRFVLCVARTRIEGAWAAYVKDVLGENHDAEEDGVLRIGTKLQERVARVLFPMFEGIPYAH